jgi:hypothetical protein
MPTTIGIITATAEPKDNLSRRQLGSGQVESQSHGLLDKTRWLSWRMMTPWDEVHFSRDASSAEERR